MTKNLKIKKVPAPNLDLDAGIFILICLMLN